MATAIKPLDEESKTPPPPHDPLKDVDKKTADQIKKQQAASQKTTDQNNKTINEAAEVLKDAKDSIKKILKDIPDIANRVIHHLEMDEAFLSGITGRVPEPTTTEKMLGPTDVDALRKARGEKPAKTPKENEGEQLNADVDGIYDDFVNWDTDALKDTLTDLQVRGIAKRAGMSVTEEDPDKITTGFIEKIKEAIRKKQQIDTATKKPPEKPNQ